MHRGGLPREAALVALVAVRQNVLVLVLDPRLEEGRDIKAAESEKLFTEWIKMQSGHTKNLLFAFYCILSGSLNCASH